MHAETVTLQQPASGPVPLSQLTLGWFPACPCPSQRSESPRSLKMGSLCLEGEVIPHVHEVVDPAYVRLAPPLSQGLRCLNNLWILRVTLGRYRILSCVIHPWLFCLLFTDFTRNRNVGGRVPIGYFSSITGICQQ